MTNDQSTMPAKRSSDRSRKPKRNNDRSGRPARNRSDRGRTENGWRAERNGRRHNQRSGGKRRPPYHGQRPSKISPARKAAIAAFDPATSQFGSLGVAEQVVKILGVDGITEPTPVQSAVIPDAIGRRDVLGRARTGSGKTLAFGLPILARLAGSRSEPSHPRALIIVPTRELATQVASAIEPLAEALRLQLVTVYGGVSYDRQIRRLDRGADIVVATPGRLDDLIRRGACKLEAVEIVTLDEADHLCDLGFFPVVDDLLGQTPSKGQRLLLSATLDGDVDRLVRRHLTDPARHEVDAGTSSVTTMDHHVLLAGHNHRLDVTTELVRATERSIVFTRTKVGAVRLAEDLEDAGVAAVDLHGDLSQRARERNLERFRSGRAKVVVATDVAARGIHVDGVDMVVHFDPANESKTYLHRSGRTARAGATGAVVTIATPAAAGRLADMFKKAGVSAKHVDSRTLEAPYSAQVLAEAPAAEVPAARAQAKSRPPRRRTPRRQYRGRGPRRS